MDVEFGEFKVGRKKYRYRVNGQPTRSVTEILDAIVPKQLSWWGMTTGVEGLVAIHAQENNVIELRREEDGDQAA